MSPFLLKNTQFDGFAKLFFRHCSSHVAGYDSYPDSDFVQIGLASTLILSNPTQTDCSHVSTPGDQNCSLDRFVLHFQRRINILLIEKGKLCRQGRKSVNARP